MPTSQPNVIVFFTDQQRWDTSGLHGNPLDLTPNFDRMASEGTHFANAFTKKYNCDVLVYCESFPRIEEAIAKEKQLKNWRREWKENLISEFNPDWRDLSDSVEDLV